MNVATNVAMADAGSIRPMPRHGVLAISVSKRAQLQPRIALVLFRGPID